MILFLVVLYQLNTNFNELIVLMSLIAIAAYKILPALHTILFNISAFNGNIESYYQIKNQIDIVLDKKYKKINIADDQEIEFKDSFNKLSISNIYYKFPRSENYILNDISLDFQLNKKYFITGPSGSGKSTLIDILSGILHPKKGQIYVNNQIILKENIKSLQNLISYVPQNINFFDRSLLENITLNFVDNHDIDFELINKIISLTDLKILFLRYQMGLIQI